MLRTTTRTMRYVAASALAAVVFTLLTGYAPTPDAASASPRATAFRNRLGADVTVATVTAATDTPLASTVTAQRRTSTVIRPVTPASPSGASAKRAATTDAAAGSAAAPADEAAQARSILAGYVARYPVLAGTTVSFGDAKGYQAISYYQSGRIVISTTHTASLSRIIGHEIWHVIDWRDNGVIDWGENVPPK